MKILFEYMSTRKLIPFLCSPPIMFGDRKSLGKKQNPQYIKPVTEHKKSLREEKINVNKSTRKSGKCRRLCCWLLGLSLLAGAITVAVLIGSEQPNFP